MEVRCGKCNKLFRVSDDKITGRGIKFSCTRCGEYVRITRAEFESYSLAQTAVTALDLFTPPAKPVVEPAFETEPAAAAGAEAGFAAAAAEDPKTAEPSIPAVPDFLQEREEQPSPLSDPFEESSLVMEPAPAEEPSVSPPPFGGERGTEPEKEPEAPAEPEPRHESVMEAEPGHAPSPEPKTGPAVDKEPDAPLMSKPVPEQTLEQRSAAKMEMPAAPRVETGPAVMAKPAAAAVSAAARVTAPEKAAPKKEPVPAAGTMAPKPVKETAPPVTVSTGSLVPLILGAALVLGLAGLGAYWYLQPSQPALKASGPAMVSTEGLQIINPAGSLDTNGDLLVTGVLENLTDQERAGWYIVVDVFDAQGKAINSIRMLNGRQIFTRRDYELLAKRGANVQELKDKAREPRGVVLPPKGRASFEIRYLQPPDGVASFNAALQPFDPARLQKEIEAESR